MTGLDREDEGNITKAPLHQRYEVGEGEEKAHAKNAKNAKRGEREEKVSRKDAKTQREERERKLILV